MGFCRFVGLALLTHTHTHTHKYANHQPCSHPEPADEASEKALRTAERAVQEELGPAGCSAPAHAIPTALAHLGHGDAKGGAVVLVTCVRAHPRALWAWLLLCQVRRAQAARNLLARDLPLAAHRWRGARACLDAARALCAADNATAPLGGQGWSLAEDRARQQGWLALLAADLEIMRAALGSAGAELPSPDRDAFRLLEAGPLTDEGMEAFRRLLLCRAACARGQGALAALGVREAELALLPLSSPWADAGHLELGVWRLSTGELGLGLAALQRCADGREGRRKLAPLLAMARAALASGEGGVASATLAEALALEPECYPARLLQALLQSVRNPAKALKSLAPFLLPQERAEGGPEGDVPRPGLPWIHQVLGRIAEARGDVERAQALYAEAALAG
jgi:hypothetical protein